MRERPTRRDLALLVSLRARWRPEAAARVAAVITFKAFGTLQRLRRLQLIDGWTITPAGHAALAIVDALGMARALRAEHDRVERRR